MSWTSSLFGSADVGNSSVGNSNAMANKTTVGDAVANTDHSRTGNSVGENRTSDGVGNRCGNNVREDGLSVVGDLGDVSLSVVGPVVDVLDAAVRKVNGVVTLPRGGAVVGLASVEAGAGVVVGHGVLVLVGGDLVRVDLSDGVGDRVSYGMSNWHSVSHSMTDSNSVTNANSVAKTNSMAETMTSEQLWAGSCRSQESREGDESL